jgi:hypothetical protein
MRATTNIWSTLLLALLFLFLPVIASAQCTFSPAAGTYSGPQTVTVTCAGGLTPFYTTDGSTPSIAGYQYTAPLTVSSSQTINVIAAQVGVLVRNAGATNTSWKCNTVSGGTSNGITCVVGGGIGSIQPSAWNWTFGSPMVESVSTTSSTGETQMLFIHGTSSTACTTCTELVEDKIVQPNQGPTFVANHEMDVNVNMLATFNQWHTASLQCNQQSGNPIGSGTVAGPQWQYDNQQGSWLNFNPSITYGCPLSTTQQTEARFGMHWANGDTSCTGGFSTDHYDFLTVCVGGTNGTGGTCQDFTVNKTLCGYTEPTFAQVLSLQDQHDLTNSTQSGVSPTTATRTVWNDNATLAHYGTEVTSSAAYTIGGGSPTSTGLVGQSEVVGQTTVN